MEEISEDLLDQLLSEPESKGRKPKVIERDYRTWFYGVNTSLGKCDNPDCTDERKKPMVMVWMNPNGVNMCRFCFLESWLKDE